MSTENNYVVLARKYRPKTFEQVVGQKHVIDAMKNSILNNSLHSVYLLSGTRGIGKTTIARIFTKAMNCENFAEHLEPCGKCSSCKESGEVNNPDLIEVDAASRTKVEDTRELIERMNYAPMYSRYKVFIIDEVHMLSTSSFNALLKTLEEPPEYGKFILCTTDPQKIPATVLSRCLHFHLKAFTPSQIEQQLRNILEQEHVPCSEENAAGVRALARAANGSMRDCLSLTDQALAIGGRQIKDEVVFDMLGIANDEMATDLLGAILDGHLGQAIQVLNNIRNNHSNWGNVLDQLITTAYKMLVYIMQADLNQASQAYDSDLTPKIISLLNKRMQYNDNVSIINSINTIVDAFLQAKKGIEYSPDPYYLIYIAILRTVYLTEELNQQMLNQQAVHELQPVNRNRDEVSLRGYEAKKFRKSENINILIPNDYDLNNSGKALDINFNSTETKPELDIDRQLQNIAELAENAPATSKSNAAKSEKKSAPNSASQSQPAALGNSQFNQAEIIDLQDVKPIDLAPQVGHPAAQTSQPTPVAQVAPQETAASVIPQNRNSIPSYQTQEEEDFAEQEANLLIQSETAPTNVQEQAGADDFLRFTLQRQFDQGLVQQAQSNVAQILQDYPYLNQFRNEFGVLIPNFYEEQDLNFKKLGLEKSDLAALNSLDKNKQEIESYLKVLEFAKTLDFSTVLGNLTSEDKQSNLLYITKLLADEISELFVFSKDKFNLAWQQVLLLILIKLELLPAYDLIKRLQLTREDHQFIANSVLVVDQETKQVYIPDLTGLKESDLRSENTFDFVDKLEASLTQAFTQAGYTLVTENRIEGISINFKYELTTFIRLITNLMYLKQSEASASLF